MASQIPDFDNELSLGVGADTGARATPQDAGAQIGEAAQQLGHQVISTSATAMDQAKMLSHLQNQQWISGTMANHQNMIDKWMADPVNQTDPNYSKNLDQMFKDSATDLMKQAPSPEARTQLQLEYNDLYKSRMSSAYNTEASVALQRGFNGNIMTANTNLDSYRTNLSNPNVDAGSELYKNFDKHMSAIENQYHVIAPTMERELKDQLTSQYAYGAVNTNPDLAQKILDRGYIEGRTRHFLEDAITNARGAQEIGAKQSANDFTQGLLKQAEMFPDKVLKGPDANYYMAHGYKAKEANELSTKVQYQLDVNKDFATKRDQITGSNEQSLMKTRGDMYNDLKSQDATSDKFNHDAQVFARTQKFIDESVRQLHEDPVQYLSTNNKEISSAAQAYRDDPSSGRFQSMVGLLKTYQGAAPAGQPGDKYLNLPMHEMHLLDKTQAQQYGMKITNAGPRQAGEILHGIIQQYNPEDQGTVLSDLVNHGKIPIESYAMERTIGAPFSAKLNGAILNGKALRESVGKQKGSTAEDLDKILSSNNTWADWSKNTAADNFQRQDVVAGYRGAIQTYAMGMIQDGKTPAAAVSQAVTDMTQWNHDNVRVNGRTMQVTKNQYPGTAEEFSHAVSDAIGNLDVSKINLMNDNHTPIFPVAEMAGHASVRDDAIRSIMQSKVFPNLNPDGKSFSLYVRGQANDFQMRDTSGRPITMQISDLPTYQWKSGTKTWEGNRITTWPSIWGRGKKFGDSVIGVPENKSGDDYTRGQPGGVL